VSTPLLPGPVRRGRLRTTVAPAGARRIRAGHHQVCRRVRDRRGRPRTL